MKNIIHNNPLGFTLIELLVVVLIIGILSAIAVPQYQKAVTKARFAEAFANLKTISQADIACQLEKGEFCSIADLSIEIPGTLVNDGNLETDYFIYRASENPISSECVQAYYNKEDVCICLFKNGEFTLKQNDGCREQEASFDYNKLFNIKENHSEEEIGCACC